MKRLFAQLVFGVVIATLAAGQDGGASAEFKRRANQWMVSPETAKRKAAYHTIVMDLRCVLHTRSANGHALRSFTPSAEPREKIYQPAPVASHDGFIGKRSFALCQRFLKSPGSLPHQGRARCSNTALRRGEVGP